VEIEFFAVRLPASVRPRAREPVNNQPPLPTQIERERIAKKRPAVKTGRVSSFKFQVSGFKSEVSSFRFQVSGFKSEVSSFRFQVSS
jgi:hypothetical protein